MSTTTSPASATTPAPLTDAPEVLGAINQTTGPQAGRPRRPATAPGRDLRPLHVGGVEIAQDEHGRYSLNDMHRAAMAAGNATESQRPGEFLRSAGVQAFLSVLDTDAGIHASVSSIKGGPNQGTYGARLVVLRYAAWIAPTFEVQVYQCFDDMTRGKAPGYRLDDHARRVRDVFDVAGTAVKARGLRGPARDAAVRAVVQEIAPDLLHLVPEPAPKQTPDQPDPGELVAVVRDWLQQHGAALPELSEVRALVLTRPDGTRPQVSDFRRTQPAEYVISPYTFAEVICNGLDARKVAQALKDAGHLRHEADRCTITQRLPGEGGKVKVYAIKPEILH